MPANKVKSDSQEARPSVRAAEKLAQHVDPYFMLNRDWQEQVAAIIDAEYQPVMDVLRDMYVQSWIWVSHHTNVERGNYYECRICKGEGRPRVSAIQHTPDCWISRAKRLLEDESL